MQFLAIALIGMLCVPFLGGIIVKAFFGLLIPKFIAKTAVCKTFVFCAKYPAISAARTYMDEEYNQMPEEDRRKATSAMMRSRRGRMLVT